MIQTATSAKQLFGESGGEGVKEPPPQTPKAFALYQSYPNPFNPTTTIAYDLPSMSRVTLTVYDVLGRAVAKLANGTYEQAGHHSRDFEGSKFSSGVYIYRLQAASTSGPQASYTATGKMVLVK
jgi:hypothetical protein